MRLIEDAPGGIGYLFKDGVFDGCDARRRPPPVQGDCVIDPTIVSRLIGRQRRQGPLPDAHARVNKKFLHCGRGARRWAIAAR